MIRHERLKLILWALLSAMPSCHQASSDSKLQWGFLAPGSSLLIHVPDGGTIRVCGEYFNSVRWAIQTWGVPINRSYNVVYDCTNAQINLFVQNEQYAKDQCESLKITTAFAHPLQSPQEIVDCGILAGNDAIVLHEVGHLFGLCDQYAASIGNCETNNGIVIGSVMNANNSLTLTEDDIEGIQALARKYGDATLPPENTSTCSGKIDGFITCGGLLNLDPGNLYICNGGTASLLSACSNGCSINPGVPDTCNVKEEPKSGCDGRVDGFVTCGGLLNLDAGNLYVCNGGSASLLSACANGCSINPGAPDTCIIKEEPKSGCDGRVDGFITCGGLLNLDAGNLYSCSGGAASLLSVCVNGCSINPGLPDTCN